MKRISKLICLILSLILIVFLACSCFDKEKINQRIQEKYEQYSKVYDLMEKDIEGYKLTASEESTQILAENEKHTINGVAVSYYGLEQNATKGKYYSNDIYRGKIKVSIYNDNEEQIKEILIDAYYLEEKNEKVNDMYNGAGFKKYQEKIRPTALLKYDNKIFIYCKGYETYASVYGPVPESFVFPTIFLFDLEREEIQYAGCFTGENAIEQNYIIEKE